MSRRSRPTVIVWVSDFHCGHIAGLTPPAWWTPKLRTVHEPVWKWYESRARAIRPDIVFGGGDFIDGAGQHSGGVEQITTDRNAQASMAGACLSIWRARHYVLVRGTPYHVGGEEDFEDQIADALPGATIANYRQVTVHGVVFDLKHKIGRSSVPHGRFTAQARAHLWNQLLAARGAVAPADVVIRGHVHYYAACSGVDRGRPWVSMTSPALQLPRTRYGERECEGIVDFGFLVFEVQPHGDFTWRVETVQFAHSREVPLRL